MERAVRHIPQQPVGFGWRVRHRMSLMTDHSEAVWALFNNEMASDRSKYLLFSASASGSVMAHDVEHGKNE